MVAGVSVRRAFAAALSIAALAPLCAAAEGLEKVAMGTVVRGTADLGPRQIPLPPGDWQLIARQVHSSGGNSGANNVLIARVYLGQVEAGVLKASIHAIASLDSSPGGWTRNRSICDRTDTHFAESDRNYNTRDTECWILNHIGMTLGPNPLQVHVDFYRLTDDKKRPKTAIVNSYYLVKGFGFLEVHYGVNPELEGFEPTPTADWRGNPWHRDAVGNDPKRVAYIARMKAEGERLFPLVKAGFDRRLPPGGTLAAPAVSPVPVVVPSVSPAAATPAAAPPPAPAPASAPAQKPDMAARLQQLQRLRDQNVISAEEFEQQRRRILSEL